jgi:hypothetical protein
MRIPFGGGDTPATRRGSNASYRVTWKIESEILRCGKDFQRKRYPLAIAQIAGPFAKYHIFWHDIFEPPY